MSELGIYFLFKLCKEASSKEVYTFIFGPALLLELVIDAKYINLMITSLIFLFIEFFFFLYPASLRKKL